MRKMLRTVVLATLFLGCALPPVAAKATGPLPFCLEWNTMGDMDGGEPVSPGQRKMFHLGHFLTKSDFVRTTLNEHYGQDNLLVDKAVTCYEENMIYLVEQVDDICQCSQEDKKERVLKAFNEYINDCVREATRP